MHLAKKQQILTEESQSPKSNTNFERSRKIPSLEQDFFIQKRRSSDLQKDAKKVQQLSDSDDPDLDQVNQLFQVKKNLQNLSRM